MTNNVTPIKRQRVKINTGFRFHFAEFTEEARDDIALFDSLGITLDRAAGLLDLIAEAIDEDSPRQAIECAELECRDARAILDAWWKAKARIAKKAAEPA